MTTEKRWRLANDRFFIEEPFTHEGRAALETFRREHPVFSHCAIRAAIQHAPVLYQTGKLYSWNLD